MFGPNSTSFTRCWTGFRAAFLPYSLFIMRAQSVETAVGMNPYQHAKVNQWASSIVEACLKKLTALGKPFKYIGRWGGLYDLPRVPGGVVY